MSERRGVYFLANDYVLDRTIAFLNSFRKHHADTPLCLIPFADDTDELLELQSRYDFTVWPGDPALLESCDEISRSFHGEVKGHYRKLVAWEGEYDEFIYVDTDTVLLRDMGFVFPLLDRFGFVATVSGHPAVRPWVWRDSVRDTGALEPWQIAYSAETCFVASRKECLRFADVTARLPDALELAPHMALETYEMPVLNYLMVTSGWPCTSLWALPGGGPVARWAGEPIGEVRDGQLVSPAGRPVFLVHWSGLWWQHERGELAQLPQHELWSHYRNLR